MIVIRIINYFLVKMSNEKVDTLKALGANVIRTPNVASEDPESLMYLTIKLIY